MTLSNYLQFLGISFKSTPKDIEKAYKKLSGKFLAPRMETVSDVRRIGYRKPALLRIFRP